MRRFCGDREDFPDRPLVALAIPGPDRGGQILEADHTVHEAIGLGGIMRRAKLEYELVLFAEIDFLEMLTPGEIPEMQLATVFGAEEHFGNKTVFERVRCAPFARHHRVVAKMPPAVIGKLLWSAIDLPPAERLEILRVHDKDAAGRLAVLVAERADIDAARAAMHRMRPRITGFLRELLRFDRLDEFRFFWIGLCVEDVNARGAQARHHQIPPLDVRMRRIWTQTG